MALTRQLSLLPSDIAQVAAAVPDAVPLQDSQALMPGEDQTDLEHHVHLPVVEPSPSAKTAIPVTAYVILALATYGLSSVGPLLAFQHGCTPLMKIVWRQNGTVLILLPFLYQDLKKHGWPGNKLSCPQWTGFLLASAAYAAGNICFVQSLEYTTVGNAGESHVLRQNVRTHPLCSELIGTSFFDDSSSHFCKLSGHHFAGG
jgi:hypothetical protein